MEKSNENMSVDTGAEKVDGFSLYWPNLGTLQ